MIRKTKFLFMTCLIVLVGINPVLAYEITTNIVENDIKSPSSGIVFNAQDVNDNIITNKATIIGKTIDEAVKIHLGTPSEVSGLIGIYGSVSGNFIFTNDNLIDIDVDFEGNTPAYAMAVSTMINGNHILTNNGTLKVRVLGDDYVYADAMEISGKGNQTIINYKDIMVYSASIGLYNSSTGMSIESDGNHILTNHGTITANAENAPSQTSTNSVFAQGMYSGNGNADNISNYGIINVYANVLDITSIENNIPNISDGFAVAGGIVLSEASHSETLVNNIGYINVSAIAKSGNAIAHEVLSVGRNYKIGEYALTLRDFTKYQPFAVMGSTADSISMPTINFDNSTLNLRPGTAEQGFNLGKEYSIKDMVKGYDATFPASGPGLTSISTVNPNISGAVKTVNTEVPFLTATLTGSDASNQKVKLDTNINDETVPSSTTAQIGVTQFTNQFNNVSNVLQSHFLETYQNAGFVQANNDFSGIPTGSAYPSASKWKMFLTPYANFVNNNQLNFDGNNFGFAGGLSYQFNNDFLLGGHFDINFSNYDADIFNLDTENLSFAFGLHSSYFINNSWYIGGQITGAISQNDNTYEQGNLSSEASYNGKALYMGISSGYIYKINQNHHLIPEIGISYAYSHIDNYDVNFTNASIYNMAYDSTSYHGIYAHAMLNYNGNFIFENGMIFKPSLGVGIRQNLNDNDIESKVELLGSSFTTTTTEDRTSALISAGLQFEKGDFTFGLKYNGNYGNDQQVQGGELIFEWKF